MKLIVGFGNPGANYRGTRHNIGFKMADAAAKKYSLDWLPKDKFKAEVAEGYIGDQKIIIIKPQTYYNLIGEAVIAVANFYKIEPSDILAIHDELDLPLGTIRAKIGGSDGGNNGLKSVISAIGADFARIRVGIANEFKPQADASEFVLGHLSHEEREEISEIAEHVLRLTDAFLQDNFNKETVRIEK